MKNPFKIYKPVKELIEDIKNNPEKYEIRYLSEITIYVHLVNEEETNWDFYVSHFGNGFIFVGDNMEWTTWKEKWYIYKNLAKLATPFNATQPEKTREGWMKKLGLES